MKLSSNKLHVFVLQIHEKLRQYERQSPTPVLHSASSLAEDVRLSHTHIHNPPTHTHTQPKLLFHLGTAVSHHELAPIENRRRYQK